MELPELKSLDPRLAWLLDEGRTLLGLKSGPNEYCKAGLEAWQKAMLVQQSALRARSRRRFPNPDQWLWTERSLAQASDWWSAAYKASLFPDQASVLDACCGAGVDAVALAASAQVIAVDSDPAMCLLTSTNAEAQGRRVQVENRQITSDTASRLADQAAYLHIDPDRRPGDKRTNAADQFSPPLDEIMHYLPLFQGSMVKLAPSTKISNELLQTVEEQATRMWLGNNRECRQQLLLSGVLSKGAGKQRRAVLAEPSSSTSEIPQDHHGLEIHQYAAHVLGYIASTHQARAYVFDLHPVLHASELQSAWAAEYGLQALGGDHGYYTSDKPMLSPWAQCFELIDELAWDDRRIRRWLQSVDAGLVEVKNRLIRLDAGASQRRYSGNGAQQITLLVTQLGARVRALAARRYPH